MCRFTSNIGESVAKIEGPLRMHKSLHRSLRQPSRRHGRGGQKKFGRMWKSIARKEKNRLGESKLLAQADRMQCHSQLSQGADCDKIGPARHARTLCGVCRLCPTAARKSQNGQSVVRAKIMASTCPPASLKEGFSKETQAEVESNSK